MTGNWVMKQTVRYLLSTDRADVLNHVKAYLIIVHYEKLKDRQLR